MINDWVADHFGAELDPGGEIIEVRVEGERGDCCRNLRMVAVLSGAGNSTASGIPGYRGPDGVWTRNAST